jgi:hypothetical protein
VEAEMKSYSAKPQEWEAGYNAYMAKKAMEDYRSGEKEIYVSEPQEKEQNWWEKSIDWVDKHQAEVALGIGVAVGIGAIILSAGTATPLVAAWVAGAAVAAGGTVALGTIGLNKYYERDWKENVGRNLAISAVTAGIITGAALFLTGPSMIKIGNGLAGYCVTHPSVCSRADVVLNAFDKLEEVGLMAKGGVQTLTGNSQGAAETALELQMEYLDGGVPGNSIAKEFGDQLAKLGPDALEVVQKRDDDVLEIIGHYGDDAVDIIETYGDDGIEVLLTHGEEVIPLLDQSVPSAQKWTEYIPEDFHDEIRSAFNDEPVSITLSEDFTAYRYWSGDSRTETGRWVTLNPNLTPEDAREMLALPNSNLADNVTQFTIPAGTTVLVGEATEQTSASWAGTYATGGGFQIYLSNPSVLVK